MNLPKRSSVFRDRHAKGWDMRDVVEHYSDKPYEDVVKQYVKPEQAVKPIMKKVKSK